MGIGTAPGREEVRRLQTSGPSRNLGWAGVETLLWAVLGGPGFQSYLGFKRPIWTNPSSSPGSQFSNPTNETIGPLVLFKLPPPPPPAKLQNLL